MQTSFGRLLFRISYVLMWTVFLLSFCPVRKCLKNLQFVLPFSLLLFLHVIFFLCKWRVNGFEEEKFYSKKFPTRKARAIARSLELFPVTCVYVSEVIFFIILFSLSHRFYIIRSIDVCVFLLMFFGDCLSALQSGEWRDITPSFTFHDLGLGNILILHCLIGLLQSLIRGKEGQGYVSFKAGLTAIAMTIIRQHDFCDQNLLDGIIYIPL